MSRENAAAETGSAPEQELDVRVQSQLPEQLPAGSKSAIFILGSCFHRRAQVKRIEILVDDARFRPTAQRMPRLDLFSALHPGVNAGDDDPGPVTLEGDDDPNMLSYRSGFWATVPVRMPLSGVVRLGICARLADGTDIETSLAEIPASQPATRDGQAGADSAIAIAMATFNPDKDLFQRQIDSIRGQSLDNWICLISDDCTSPAAFERMRSIIGDDPRFLIRRSDRRLGFYRNFERAVAEVPPSVPFVALSDQDDHWYPDKLEALLDRLGDAHLVYSDQRVVDPDGRVLADTYWTGRRTTTPTSHHS